MKIKKECPHCKNILYIEDGDIEPLSKEDKAWLIERKKTGNKIINETKSSFGIKTPKYSELTREAVVDILSKKGYVKTKCIVCKNTFIIFDKED